MSKYTKTPVTVTYTQIGNVFQAIILWASTWLVRPRYIDNKAMGTMAIAKIMWEIKMKK